MDKDTERVRTEQPTDRTFLHKITICIKILILLIFPCHLFTYTYVWHVFSTNFSSFFCTLKHEKNFKWPEKGPQPKGVARVARNVSSICRVRFLFTFFLLLLGFVLSKVWTSFFLFFCAAAKLFVNSKWVAASRVARVALQILWPPLRIRCFEPKCLLSLCSLLDEVDVDLERRIRDSAWIYFISFLLNIFNKYSIILYLQRLSLCKNINKGVWSKRNKY